LWAEEEQLRSGRRRRKGGKQRESRGWRGRWKEREGRPVGLGVVVPDIGVGLGNAGVGDGGHPSRGKNQDRRGLQAGVKRQSKGGVIRLPLSRLESTREGGSRGFPQGPSFLERDLEGKRGERGSEESPRLQAA
jgi:hypothetical protein